MRNPSEIRKAAEKVCQGRSKMGPDSGVKSGHTTFAACPRSPREGPVCPRGQARRGVGSAGCWLSMPAALIEPEALAVHLEDVDVVRWPRQPDNPST